MLLSLLIVAAAAPVNYAAAPDGWELHDVGSQGLARVDQANDAIIITGGGDSLEGDEARKGHDRFAYLSRQISGDFQLVARVTRLDGAVNSRAALMVRQTTDPDGRYVSMSFRDGRVYGFRRDFGPMLINQGVDSALGERYAVSLPLWMKLVRCGRYVCGYTSADGLNWLSLNNGVEIGLGETVRVGLLVNRGEAKGVASAAFDHLSAGPLKLDYHTSWFGNTSGDTHWVQDHIAGMCVGPDGRCYTHAEWDEGGRNAGIYQNGQAIGALRGSSWGIGGRGICRDGPFIYISCEIDKKAAVRRFTLEGLPANFDLPKAKDNILRFGADVSGIAAIAVRDQSVYLVDSIDTRNGLASDDQVKRFDISDGSPALRASVEIPRPGRLAIDRAGRVWAIQGALRDRSALLRVGGKILCLTPELRRTAIEITQVQEPTAVAIDNQGRLMAADNGPDQQVKIFDELDGSPRLVATLGEKGGVFAGRPGEVGDQKLTPNVVGLGTDDAGDIYVGSDGWSWCGADIRKFTPDGKLAWRVQGAMGVVQFAAFDPADPTQLFNKSMHYEMDWSKPAGQEAAWKGYTFDPRAFPDDPRNHIACESTLPRTIGGRRFSFKTNMWGSFLAVYRFDAGHGEIAIPCALFSRDRLMEHPGEPCETYWPREQPRGSSWIWLDKNGDALIHKEEMVATRSGNTWDIDANGDIWSAGDKVYRHRFAGLDDHGAPTWQTVAEQSPRPAPFNGEHDDLRRIKYVAATDTLYLSGYTKDYPNHPYNGFPVAGRVFARYDNWSRSRTPAPATQIVFPYDPFSGGLAQEGLDVAGDYLFVVSLYDAQVLVYDLRNGNLVATLVAGPEIAGFSGWVDMPYSLSAHKLDSGEYLVLAEEDGRNKEIIYRWKPNLLARPAPPTLNVIDGKLSWAADITQGSFNLYRAKPGEKPALLRRNLISGAFADASLLDGSYVYTVTAVNAAGESDPSNPVTLEGLPGNLARLHGAILSAATPPEKGFEPERAFDDDPATQYRSSEQTGGWVGLDLGASQPRQILKVRFLGAKDPNLFMVGGKFQATNADPVKGRWTDLAQIEQEPAGWAELRVVDPTPYRFVRYIGPAGSRCNVNELQFYGRD